MFPLTVTSKKIIKPLSLKKNFTWTFFGNVIYACSQWIIMMIIAKMGTAALVGQYSLALAFTAPIVLLTNLKLRSVQATDTTDNYKFYDYLGLRLITIVFSIILTFIFCLLGNYDTNTVVIILLVLLCKTVESISDIIFGLLQKNERMDKIGLSLMLKAIMTLASFLLLFLITRSLVITLIGQVLVWGLILGFFDIKNAKKYSSSNNKTALKISYQLFKTAFPLGIVQMLVSLNTNIPRYLIENYHGQNYLGYFAALSYIIVAGNTVISALAQSASPRLARHYQQNIHLFKKLVSKLMLFSLAFGLLGTLIVFLLGDKILILIYSKEYAMYLDVFLIIAISGFLNYAGWFLEAALTASKSYKVQPYIAVCCVLISLIGSYLLIPKNGLMGAALILLLSSSVQLVLKIIALKNSLRKSIQIPN